jgi:hypothetical protein
MAKLHLETPIASGPNNLNPYPVIDRFKLSTLPARGTLNKVVFVTDGTFAVSSGQGQAYVGGGTLLNVLWWNGQAWITL